MVIERFSSLYGAVSREVPIGLPLLRDTGGDPFRPGEGRVVDGSDPQTSSPGAAPKAPRLSRFLDILALLLIAAAVWKFFLGPRIFGSRTAVVQAPPVRLPLMDGGTFNLAGARGHVVFLDFWASWCEPCKQSIPLIERYKALHPDALVYSVDAGESISVAKRYATAAKMRRVAFDPDLNVADAFHVSVFPTMIVIGRDGKEHAKWIGFNPQIQDEMARAAQEY